MPDRQVAQVARRVVGQWCARDVADYRAPLRAQHVEAIAAAMFISIKEDWELTEEFLRLHNRAQLAALVKEWGLTGVDAGGKVGALIADLLARRDACPCPKEVLQVKGAQLRKYD